MLAWPAAVDSALLQLAARLFFFLVMFLSYPRSVRCNRWLPSEHLLSCHAWACSIALRKKIQCKTYLRHGSKPSQAAIRSHKAFCSGEACLQWRGVPPKSCMSTSKNRTRAASWARGDDGVGDADEWISDRSLLWDSSLRPPAPTKLKRQLTPRSRLESWFPLSLGLAQRTLLTNGIRVRDVKYTWPGSSWRPSACEADVIATRPQVLLKLLKENCCKVWRLPDARHS